MESYRDAGFAQEKRVSASASSIGANSAMWWPESMPCPSTLVAQFRQITSGSPYRASRSLHPPSQRPIG